MTAKVGYILLQINKTVENPERKGRQNNIRMPDID